MGTAVLALIVSLDGDGSTTCTDRHRGGDAAALQRLGLSRLVLASVIMLAGGVMNILPWGGPTARAAAALRVDAGGIVRADDSGHGGGRGLGDLRGLARSGCASGRGSA